MNLDQEQVSLKVPLLAGSGGFGLATSQKLAQINYTLTLGLENPAEFLKKLRDQLKPQKAAEADKIKQAILRLTYMGFTPAQTLIVLKDISKATIESWDIETLINNVTNIVLDQQIEEIEETKKGDEMQPISEDIRKTLKTGLTFQSGSLSEESKKEIICNICQVEFDNNTERYKIQGCGHEFHKDCVIGQLRNLIQERNLKDIPCLMADCKNHLNENTIKNLLPEADYARQQKFKLYKEQENNPNVRWCIRPDCGKPIIKKNDNIKLQCVCGQLVCFQCKNEWHEGRLCNESIDKQFESAIMKFHQKRCPQCNALIEKFAGCNHVTCKKCGQEFCWLCFKKYTEDHFNEDNAAGCPGKQFYVPPGEVINEEHDEQAPQHVAPPVQHPYVPPEPEEILTKCQKTGIFCWSFVKNFVLSILAFLGMILIIPVNCLLTFFYFCFFPPEDEEYKCLTKIVVSTVGQPVLYFVSLYKWMKKYFEAISRLD